MPILRSLKLFPDAALGQCKSGQFTKTFPRLCDKVPKR